MTLSPGTPPKPPEPGPIPTASKKSANAEPTGVARIPHTLRRSHPPPHQTPLSRLRLPRRVLSRLPSVNKPVALTQRRIARRKDRVNDISFRAIELAPGHFNKPCATPTPGQAPDEATKAPPGIREQRSGPNSKLWKALAAPHRRTFMPRRSQTLARQPCGFTSTFTHTVPNANARARGRSRGGRCNDALPVFFQQPWRRAM